MTDQVSVHAGPLPGTVTVRVGGQNVVLGFIAAGAPAPFRLEQGRLVPVVTAQHYVTMSEWHAYSRADQGRNYSGDRDSRRPVHSAMAVWPVIRRGGPSVRVPP